MIDSITKEPIRVGRYPEAWPYIRMPLDQLDQVKKRVDYEEVGGAPLLGVRGVAMIAHGRSTHRAILNALSGAEAFAQQHLDEDLAAAALRGEELLAHRAAS